jgi:c-di-GMP-binding flagellar brake protein YcgR
MSELRLSPRFFCRWPVEIVGPEDRRFQAQAADISVTGMAMLVDRVAAAFLAPTGGVLSPRVPPVSVAVQAPGHAEVGKLRFEGRVRHIRRLSQEQYLIGIKFTDPDASFQHELRALVEQAMRSPRG